jgi:hypothetical protein
LVYVDGVLKTFTTDYTIDRSSNPNNCEINFKEAIQGNAQVSAEFGEIVFVPSENGKSNIIKLPIEMFYRVESDIIVKMKLLNSSIVTVLEPGDYKILDSKNIQIENKAFNSLATYYAAYVPGFKINNNYITKTNEIEISAMYPYNRTTLRFDYTYQNIYDSTLIKYYTPIGLDYTMEII